MAGNRYDSLATPLGVKRVRPIPNHMLSLILFFACLIYRLSFDVVIMHKFCGARVVFFAFDIMLSFTFWVMSRVGKGLCIPSHTLTCIFIT